MKELRSSLTKNSNNQRSRRTSFCSDDHIMNSHDGLSIVNTIRTAELVLITTLGLITVLLVLRGQPPHHMHHPHHPSSLGVGSIVELYEDGTSYFAIPAIITDEMTPSSSSSTSTSPPSPREDDNNNTFNDKQPTTHQKIYSLTNVITNIQISSIPSNYIHPYQPYEDGAMASCNIAALRTVQMKPCAIVSHSIRSNSGLVTYQVSYLNKDDVLIHENLPFSRVQRRIHVEG